MWQNQHQQLGGQKGISREIEKIPPSNMITIMITVILIDF